MVEGFLPRCLKAMCAFSTFPFNRYGKRTTKKRYKKATKWEKYSYIDYKIVKTSCQKGVNWKIHLDYYFG